MRGKRIVHVMLCAPYTIGNNYQDNLLPAAQAELGLDVICITSCYEWKEDKLRRVAPCDMVLENGVRLIRLPYVQYLGSEGFSAKIRDAQGLAELLRQLKPDRIMMHGGQSKSTKVVCDYVKDTRIPFVMDSHADLHNSATNWFSRTVLHGLYYKHYMKMAWRRADKVYYLTTECKEFLQKIYGFPEDKMEYLPSGGICFDDQSYKETRDRKRQEEGLQDEDVLIVHSGKLDKGKKTVELLHAFSNVPDDHAKLFILGEAEPEILSEIQHYENQDARIRFLGWKTGSELLQYLCAADVYAQPGTQSATLQNSLCCRCAVIVYPYPSYRELLQQYALYAANESELQKSLQIVLEQVQVRKRLREEGFRLALQKLDYQTQAKRVAGI